MLAGQDYLLQQGFVFVWLDQVELKEVPGKADNLDHSPTETPLVLGH